MNDLILTDGINRAFPHLADQLRKADEMFSSIENFDDLERVFLRGQGLSPHTYRSHLQAIKQLYHYLEGKHPFQVSIADIEAFYDDLLARDVTRNTAALRIQGLRKFFQRVEEACPFFSSPFKVCTEKLHRKLSRTTKSARKKRALTAEETVRVLNYLQNLAEIEQEDKAGTIHLENYSLIMFLITSGLRAAETCALRWGDIEEIDGQPIAYFIGKGGKPAEQALYIPALELARTYFQRAFHRKPTNDDHLFYTSQTYPGEKLRPITYMAVLYRLRKMGAEIREKGVIRRTVTWSWHLFRRTCATWLSHHGYDVVAIAHHLRHSSVNTTAKHYIDPKVIEPAAWGELKTEVA